jgi:hypothetical protein
MAVNHHEILYPVKKIYDFLNHKHIKAGAKLYQNDTTDN